MKQKSPHARSQRQTETRLRKEKRSKDMLPYAHMVDGCTIATRDGQLVRVIHLAGFAFETAETQELNYRKHSRTEERQKQFNVVDHRQRAVGSGRRLIAVANQATSACPGAALKMVREAGPT